MWVLLHATCGVPPFMGLCTYLSILLLVDVEENPRIWWKIHGRGGPILWKEETANYWKEWKNCLKIHEYVARRLHQLPSSRYRPLEITSDARRHMIWGPSKTSVENRSVVVWFSILDSRLSSRPLLWPGELCLNWSSVSMEIYEQKGRTWSYMSWNAWKNGSDVDVWWFDRLGKIECGWKLRFVKMDCWCRWRGVEDKEGDCLSTSTRMIRVVNDTSCYCTDSTVQSCQPSALISAHTQVKWGSGQGWVFAEGFLVAIAPVGNNWWEWSGCSCWWLHRINKIKTKAMRLDNFNL